MIGIFTLLLAVSQAVCLETGVRQPEDPNSEEVFVSNFAAAGSGCRDGATGLSFSLDRKKCVLALALSSPKKASWINKAYTV